MPTCVSCHAPLTGRWCAQCGEKRIEPQDLSLKGIWHDVISDVFQYDGRIWRTVRDLVTAPGALTLAWRNGQRGQYVKPFSFFVAVNVLFFLLLPDGFWRWDYGEFHEDGGDNFFTRQLDAAQAARGESREVFKTRFNMLASGARQSLLLLGVPIMAITVGMLQWRKRAGAAVHLIFSVHAWAWYLLWWIIGWTALSTAMLWSVRRIVHVFPSWQPVLQASMQFLLGSEEGLALSIGSGMVVWGAFAFRRVYGDGTAASWTKAVAYYLMMWWFLPLFRSVVGLMAMWQVR
jgi:hypothetical protein